MKRALVLGCVALLVLCAPGCGGNSPESIFKRSISDLNTLAEALEQKESPDKIKATAERLKADSDQLKGLNLPQEELEKLKKKFEKELADAATKLVNAAGKNPEGLAAIRDTIKGFDLVEIPVDDPDSLLTQMIADWDALADALEKKASAETIKAAGAKIKVAADKLKNMKLPKDDEQRLKKKYEKDLMEVSTKMMGAAMKNPEGAAAMYEVIKGLGQ